MEQSRNTSGKIAALVRYALAGMFAVLLFGILTGRNESCLNPFDTGRVHAVGGISATPGYLSLNVRNSQHFYIIDTKAAPRRVCIYKLDNDQPMLVSARSVDDDLQILDTNLKNAPTTFKFGGKGATVQEAEQYLKESNHLLSADKKSNKGVAP